ncbi:hypothetical protein GGX14DRAFT_396071 [Mycena pura]|uniref:Uncharacterized protein n=1 Tax=Mycena pura TaxID=153505 RepID=A0AAD6YBR0_9AGAR|nr:hypothetical protein GGX14DRAFT_396071 [Mycena pura]
MSHVEAATKYEKAASDEREEMASSLRGPKPPCASLSNPSSDPPTVVPPLPSSRLLPTDSGAIKYPGKTLESVAASGVIGSLTSTERAEQRDRDADYCARHLAGRVVRSSLKAVLTRLGTLAMVEKLSELEAEASLQLGPTL